MVMDTFDNWRQEFQDEDNDMSARMQETKSNGEEHSNVEHAEIEPDGEDLPGRRRHGMGAGGQEAPQPLHSDER